jgi:hypothetical protein
MELMKGKTECDFCGEIFQIPDRRVVALPRPSNPLEICAVMWGCGRCEDSAELPTATHVENTVIETQTWNGERALWVNV